MRTRQTIIWITGLIALIAYLCFVIAHNGYSSDALTYGFTAASIGHLFTTALVVLTFVLTSVFFLFMRKLDNRHERLSDRQCRTETDYWELKNELAELRRKLNARTVKPVGKKK